MACASRGYLVKTILMVEMICTRSVYFSENYSNGISQTETSKLF